MLQILLIHLPNKFFEKLILKNFLNKKLIEKIKLNYVTNIIDSIAK